MAFALHAHLCCDGFDLVQIGSDQHDIGGGDVLLKPRVPPEK
jgi:hypothetical protein